MLGDGCSEHITCLILGFFTENFDMFMGGKVVCEEWRVLMGLHGDEFAVVVECWRGRGP